MHKPHPSDDMNQSAIRILILTSYKRVSVEYLKYDSYLKINKYFNKKIVEITDNYVNKS